MTKNKYELKKVKMLASLIMGSGEQGYTFATVQRSHRFPLHLFVQMENLATHAKVPVSVIINELIECGLDELKAELPEELAQKISRYTKEQSEKANSNDSFDSEKHRAKAAKKRKGKE